MLFKVNILHTLCVFTIFLGTLSSSEDNDAPIWSSYRRPEIIQKPQKVLNLRDGLEMFGKRLFSELEKTNREKNIFISPLSIEMCLGMARMGAEHKTALEIDTNFAALPNQNRNKLANNFRSLFEPYENSSILKIANKIYIKEGSEIQEEFNKLLTEQFFSSVEAVNFVNSTEAARTINTWVEDKTNHLVKDLIKSDSLNVNTALVLVNAIHFKGEWEKPFNKSDTREMDFYLDETKTTKVQMMSTKAYFYFATLSDIDATALEMPYANSDLSMLIILPNSRSGLAALVENLKNISLSAIEQKMFKGEVYVKLPRFKTEFEVELSVALKQLDIKRMFSDDAEFGKILKSPDLLKVSQFVHKAVIAVNEEGTEAAAASGMELIVHMLTDDEYFTADKPFVYYIKNNNNDVIFTGNVKHFN